MKIDPDPPWQHGKLALSRLFEDQSLKLQFPIFFFLISQWENNVPITDWMSLQIHKQISISEIILHFI